MSDLDTQGGQLEREADTLVEIFNDATPDYSPHLEWFGMSIDRETESEQFVLEAKEYIDNAGLDALRDHGRAVGYIEAYEFEGEVTVQIQVPVQGEVPGESGPNQNRTEEP